MPHLLDPLQLRNMTIRNRIGMSPMCTYSCDAFDGIPTNWHLHHLASRAAGGCGLVITEATAIEPRGRISLGDCGIWNDYQVKAWKPIVRAIEDMGALACIQLAHAGRKAGTRRPWESRGPYTDAEFSDGVHMLADLMPIAPSAIPFNDDYRVPHMLEKREILQLVERWAQAANRADLAGFSALELHMAHGYLLHQFLSPLTNRRDDSFGGDFEGRIGFPLIVAQAVSEVWPDTKPLLVRLSCTDWAEGGWDIEDSIAFAHRLKEIGVDMVDCSSGGAVANARITPVSGQIEPGYQVEFARRIRLEAQIPTAAVGLITEPSQANTIIEEGSADIVLLGRELLRNPYWPLTAARSLGADPSWPRQYGWAVG